LLSQLVMLTTKLSFEESLPNPNMPLLFNPLFRLSKTLFNSVLSLSEFKVVKSADSALVLVDS
jgi:hypothetical protein